MIASMTITALSALTGIPTRTISHWLAIGRIRGQQLGGRRQWTIDAADAERRENLGKGEVMISL
jgi:hypothetical protein